MYLKYPTKYHTHAMICAKKYITNINLTRDSHS